MQVFRNYWEMLAYIRHRGAEIDHKAVPVEQIKKKKKSKKKEK